jgi:hypothetical protein
MVVQINKIVGDEETTESVKTFPGPGPETITKQIKAIDWTNVQQRPAVGLGRTMDDGTIRNLSVKGTLGAPNVDGEFRAYWMGLVDEEAAFRKSPPLDSVDAAIELLLLFVNDYDELKSIVREWENAE